MSDLFMHIGKFVVQPEKHDDFVALMREYEGSVRQDGLSHSNVVEDEETSNTFLNVTFWNTRDDWVAIEKTDAHQKMHTARNAMLAEEMQHDFLCGKVHV